MMLIDWLLGVAILATAALVIISRIASPIVIVAAMFVVAILWALALGRVTRSRSKGD